MKYQYFTIEQRERALILTINRPSSLNALCVELVDELLYFFLQGHSGYQDYSAVIITGSGEKAFVAGADISEFTDLKTGEGKAFSNKGQQAMFAIEHFHKPVVAAVNGYALGGGFELALACHVRIAAATAKFGLPEVNLGLLPGFGGTQRLTHVSGKGAAFYLSLTGNIIDAGEALRIGAVNEVVEQANLISHCLGIVSKLSKKAPIALGKVIESVNAANDLRGDAGYGVESDAFESLIGTSDFVEGVDAFLKKRKPDFKGE